MSRLNARTTSARLHRALDDVIACEALVPSESYGLKAEYLLVDKMFDERNNLRPPDATHLANDPRVLGSHQISCTIADPGTDPVDLRCLEMLAARVGAEPASDPTGDSEPAGVLRAASGSTAESGSERLIM